MIDVEQVVWPTPNALLAGLGEVNELASALRCAETDRANLDIQAASAGGRTTDHSDIAIRLATADEEFTVLVELQFPITIPEMRDLVRSMTHSMLLLLAYRADAPAVHSESELFALGGEDGFVEWAEAEMVGEDVAFDCSGYGIEDDGGRTIRNGLQLVVSFQGSQVSADIPFPFAVPALCKFGLAISDLARGEWERANFGYYYSTRGIVSWLPFLEPEVVAFAASLSQLRATDETVEEAVKGWAQRRAQTLLLECSPRVVSGLNVSPDTTEKALAQAVLEIWYSNEPKVTDATDFEAVSRPEPSFVVAPQPTPQRAAMTTSTTTQPEPAAQPDTPGFLASRPQLIPAALSAVALVAALGAHPYSYYQWLRAVVFATCCLVVWLTLEWRGRMGPRDRTRSDILGGGCALLAVLFNPLVPITLERGTWAPIDVAAAAWIFSAGLLTRRQH